MNNFQAPKVRLQGAAKLFLDLYQFQPGVAYKSVAYVDIYIYIYEGPSPKLALIEGGSRGNIESQLRM